MSGMVRFLYGVAAVLAFAIAAQSCNTIRGVGKDVEAGGKAIQRSTTK
ncbi:MAG: hypothetical protein AMXMBFR4_10380 [Candidatus Hydrogenedentota bacterium]